jgi:uncharacterized protein YkwD
MTTGRRVATLVLLTLLALQLACVPAGARAKPLSGAERRVVELINSVRAQHGCAPVKISYALSRAAERHSREMVRYGYFSHSSLAGQTLGSRIMRSGYRGVGTRALRVGEVISWGAGALGSAESIVYRWLRSPTHRTIILSRAWRHIGVGRVVGTFQGVSGAAVCTVDFACRR